MHNINYVTLQIQRIHYYSCGTIDRSCTLLIMWHCRYKMLIFHIQNEDWIYFQI